MFWYGKQVFYIVPCLHQYAQYTIIFIARSRSHALGDLFLYHAAATGYEVFVVEYFEKYLARYVVRIIADDAETPGKSFIETQF